MRRNRIITLGTAALLVAAILLGQGALAQSGGSYDVWWSVVGTAGDQFVAGGDYQLGFTLAQSQEPGLSTGGDYQVVQGYWAHGGIHPTAVELLDLHVEVRAGTLVVCWETATEIDTLGFHLYRSENGGQGTFVRLNGALIPSQSPGSGAGANYEWVDDTAVAGLVYAYLLEDVDAQGVVTSHGPVLGTLSYRVVYLPLVVKGD